MQIHKQEIRLRKQREKTNQGKGEAKQLLVQSSIDDEFEEIEKDEDNFQFRKQEDDDQLSFIADLLQSRQISGGVSRSVSPQMKFRFTLDDLHENPMPLIKEGMSLEPDMAFGWKPQIDCQSPPIPLYFDFVDHPLHLYSLEKGKDILIYQEKRPKDSFQVHKQFSNKWLTQFHVQEVMQNDLSMGEFYDKKSFMSSCLGQSYQFKFPKNYEHGKFKYDKILSDIFGDYQSDTAIINTGMGSSFIDYKEFQFIGMNPKVLRKNEQHKYDVKLSPLECLVFNSAFESGNLDLAFKTKEGEYDLFLRPDSNSIGKFQWYYFKVQNRLKGTRVKFNIVNMNKRNSLYLQGLQISIMSLQKSRQTGQGWYKGGENIKYCYSKVNRDISFNQGTQNGAGSEPQTSVPRHKPQITYYELSFDFEFEFDADEVSFAFSTPYTFSMLLNFLNHSFEVQRLNVLQNKSDDFKIFDYNFYTKTLGGIDIPLVTITNHLEKFNKDIASNIQQSQTNDKQYVFIISRVHPGETNSSYLIHGIIQYLLSKDKIANYLRDNLVFKIIPMINPDGVVVGNNRTSFLGRDMNRSYDNPSEQLNPETFSVKQIINDIIKQQKLDKYMYGGSKILAIFDIHQHSGRKSIFMYAPYYPLHSRKYLKIRIMPKLLSERSEMFRYFSCKFRFEQYKQGCARQALWNAFNIQNCYTIECSALGYYNKDRETNQFDELNLREFGVHFSHSLFEYCMIQEQERLTRIELAKQIQLKRKQAKKTIRDIIGIKINQKQQQSQIQVKVIDLEENNDSDSEESEQQTSSEEEIKANQEETKAKTNSQVLRSQNSLNDPKEEQKIINKLKILDKLDFKSSKLRLNSNSSNTSHRPAKQSQNNIKKSKFINKSSIRDSLRNSSSQCQENVQQQNASIIIENNPNEAIQIETLSSDEDYMNDYGLEDDNWFGLQNLDIRYKKNSDKDVVAAMKPKLDQHERIIERNKKIQEEKLKERVFGFNTINSEVLFMRLYNPHFKEWKAKYDEFKQKDKSQSQSKQNMHSQRNEFFNKQVRTLDELFGLIKKDAQKEEEEKDLSFENNLLHHDQKQNLDDLEKTQVLSNEKKVIQRRQILLNQGLNSASEQRQTESLPKQKLPNKFPDLINLDQQVLGRTQKQYRIQEQNRSNPNNRSQGSANMNSNNRTQFSSQVSQENMSKVQKIISNGRNLPFSENQNQSQKLQQANIYELIFEQKRKLQQIREKRKKSQIQDFSQLQIINSAGVTHQDQSNISLPSFNQSNLTQAKKDKLLQKLKKIKQKQNNFTQSQPQVEAKKPVITRPTTQMSQTFYNGGMKAMKRRNCSLKNNSDGSDQAFMINRRNIQNKTLNSFIHQISPVKNSNDVKITQKSLEGARSLVDQPRCGTAVPTINKSVKLERRLNRQLKEKQIQQESEESQSPYQNMKRSKKDGEYITISDIIDKNSQVNHNSQPIPNLPPAHKTSDQNSYRAYSPIDHKNTVNNSNNSNMYQFNNFSITVKIDKKQKQAEKVPIANHNTNPTKVNEDNNSPNIKLKSIDKDNESIENFPQLSINYVQSSPFSSKFQNDSLEVANKLSLSPDRIRSKLNTALNFSSQIQIPDRISTSSQNTKNQRFNQDLVMDKLSSSRNNIRPPGGYSSYSKQNYDFQEELAINLKRDIKIDTLKSIFNQSQEPRNKVRGELSVNKSLNAEEIIKLQ
ncbi:zinc carboxypeptidase family protein [Stylonychia lemnae]|uniref:Zinc carboxypeptidase family protein n=1 Tax=Stylonychia lemnae TaxID=5949 RepID=A0A078A3R8_STYLE|nr:zinc carboxypeptidase family protein [Stylonychia lemnae]|eukprot:CDW76472.1 zinc carboxypeptidase family protein [Stylonychia lemnae]